MVIVVAYCIACEMLLLMVSFYCFFLLLFKLADIEIEIVVVVVVDEHYSGSAGCGGHHDHRMSHCPSSTW